MIDYDSAKVVIMEHRESYVKDNIVNLCKELDQELKQWETTDFHSNKYSIEIYSSDEVVIPVIQDYRKNGWKVDLIKLNQNSLTSDPNYIVIFYLEKS